MTYSSKSGRAPIAMQLADAQLMHRDHPTTFLVPSDQELGAVSEGYFAKVSAEPERFWVRVTARSAEKLHGIIDNDLLATDQHGLRCGDEIDFEERHIYAIQLP